MFHKTKLFFGPTDIERESSLPFSLVAAGSTNATLVKSSPGVITAIHAINVNAAVRYLKFYDMRSVPTAGSLGIVRRFGIPGATTGAGFVFTPTAPIGFQAGIAFVLVTGAGDTDATAVSANDVILTIEYL